MQKQNLAFGAVAVFLVFLWYMSRGTLPVITVDPATLGDNQYDPFIHWRTNCPAEWVHPHPLQIGMNCLPQILQNQDAGLALSQAEVDSAACAQ